METGNLEQKKIGQRIKSARVLTGLNQEEFAQHEGFNHTSLRNWEFGRVTPRIEAIKKLIQSFRNFGIFVYPEWILSGSGEGPSLANEILPFNDIQNDSLVIQAFRKSVENSGGKSIVATVDSECMKPFFNNGDIICGISTHIHEVQKLPHSQKNTLLMEPTLVKVAGMDFQPRFLNFDGKSWWSRGQDSLLEPLSSDIIGIIKMRIYASAK